MQSGVRLQTCSGHTLSRSLRILKESAYGWICGSLHIQPQSKGKIERFFRTCRAQLIARLSDTDKASLESMNRRLSAWLEGEYHQCPHRGIDNETPMERWARVADGVTYPDAHLDLDDLFLFEEKRKVQNDRTVSLNGRLFEVDATLIGEKVTLRYDPSRPDASVQVVHENRVIEKARQVDVYANCFVKRQRRGSTIDADGTADIPSSSLSMKALDKGKETDGSKEDDDQGGMEPCI